MKYLLIFVVLVVPILAHAQTAVIFCIPNSPTNLSSCIPVDINHPLPVVSN